MIVGTRQVRQQVPYRCLAPRVRSKGLIVSRSHPSIQIANVNQGVSDHIARNMAVHWRVSSTQGLNVTGAPWGRRKIQGLTINSTWPDNSMILRNDKADRVEFGSPLLCIDAAVTSPDSLLSAAGVWLCNKE